MRIVEVQLALLVIVDCAYNCGRLFSGDKINCVVRVGDCLVTYIGDFGSLNW